MLRCLLACLVALFFIFSPARVSRAQAVASLVCRLDPTQVLPDGTSLLIIDVVNVTDLAGFAFQMHYDRDLVQLEDANPLEAGINFAYGSFITPAAVTKNYADNDPGVAELQVMGSLGGEPGTSGTGRLAQIGVHSFGAGTAVFTFDWIVLYDPQSNDIAVNDPQECTLAIGTDPTSTPTPSPTVLWATDTPTPTATQQPQPEQPTSQPYTIPDTPTPTPGVTSTATPTLVPAPVSTQPPTASPTLFVIVPDLTPTPPVEPAATIVPAASLSVPPQSSASETAGAPLTRTVTPTATLRKSLATPRPGPSPTPILVAALPPIAPTPQVRAASAGVSSSAGVLAWGGGALLLGAAGVAAVLWRYARHP